LDGELILGSPTAKDVYRQTVGACSRHEGEPDVIFYAFDDFSRPALRYAQRAPAPHSAWGRNIKALENQLIRNEDHLLGYEAEILEQGYEGLILRSPDGVYKFGRSTVNQQGMMKLKRFTDGEFLLLDIEEEMENQNVAKTNALGRTERSSAQAGLVPKGRAGTLCVRDLSSKVEFRIGTGLSDADKAWFWKHRKKLVAGGFVGKYKSFLIGVKDKPRFPVYLGPREKWDL
jgi:DNA ligase-1